jgi:xanthine dehydrogenase small subunit
MNTTSPLGQPVVRVDAGRAVNACLVTAGQAHGGAIVTVEGLTEDPIGAPLLDAFAQAGAVQCGFCTPGLVVAARALLAETGAPSVEAIQHGLSGNLCRCTGYAKIVKAVAAAAPAGRLPGVNSTQPAPPAIVVVAPTFARPATLDAALELLAQPGQRWRVIAGGTDILVQHEHQLKALNLLDLSGLSELRGIDETDDELRIGALASFAEIIRSPLAQTWAVPLVMAAREVGGAQIQNMATIGGNLANASPATDSLPPLYVLDARLTLRSARAPSRRKTSHSGRAGPRSNTAS